MGTKDRLDRLYQRVLSHIASLGGHPTLAALVKKLHRKLEPPPVAVATASVASSEPSKADTSRSPTGSSSTSNTKADQGHNAVAPAAGGCALHERRFALAFRGFLPIRGVLFCPYVCALQCGLQC